MVHVSKSFRMTNIDHGISYDDNDYTMTINRVWFPVVAEFVCDNNKNNDLDSLFTLNMVFLFLYEN